MEAENENLCFKATSPEAVFPKDQCSGKSSKRVRIMSACTEMHKKSLEKQSQQSTCKSGKKKPTKQILDPF